MRKEKVENMNIFLGIFVCTLLLVVFLFIAVRRQMKVRNHKKLSINRILNYPYFCLGDIINILFFILFIAGFSILFGIMMNTVNWAEINWANRIFLGIPILLIIWGVYLILLSDIFVRPVKITRNPKEIVNVHMGLTPDLFENTLYDLRLNGSASLIFSRDEFSNLCQGDLIFCSEGIGNKITGRWILLKIFIAKYKDDVVEIQAEPCRVVSDKMIAVEDNRNRELYHYEKN